MQNTTEKYLINEEKWLDDISLSLIPWDKIFFYGDLGAGKTTYIRKLIQRYLHDTSIVVRSPTYTYYSLYEKEGFFPIYHFDLYRLESVEVFFSIGGMEILEQKKCYPPHRMARNTLKPHRTNKKNHPHKMRESNWQNLRNIPKLVVFIVFYPHKKYKIK